MDKLPALGIGAAVLFAGAVALAQDAKAPPSSGQSATAQPMDSTAQMDKHMKKMQALHDKMISATTPEERQKAMEEAGKEMQAGMTMMKPMMQGGGMMGGGSAAPQSAPRATD
jgi:hypothetical protein